MSSQILLYSGPGAHFYCIEAMEKQIVEYCDERQYSIRKIDSFRDLISQAANSTCSFDDLLHSYFQKLGIKGK